LRLRWRRLLQPLAAHGPDPEQAGTADHRRRHRQVGRPSGFV